MNDSAAKTTTGRTRALRRDAVQNRERLMHAAWQAFAELGPEAGVEDIARRAGVGMGTLYRRFPTKQALVLALHQDLIDDMLDHARKAAADDPAGRGLEDFLWYIGAVMSTHHGCLSQLWRSPPPGSNGHRQQMWALIAQMLAQAAAAGQVRAELTLTDIYLCILCLRGLIEDTAAQAPDIWQRHLSVTLAGFAPAPRSLEHRPVDDSLVEIGVPAPAR